MNKDNCSKKSKVTLDIELQDLLDIVSKSGSSSIISESSTHIVEGEDIKKAWFKHMLISMEKLNDLVEDIRRVDMVNLRTEMKQEVQKLDDKFVKAEDELKIYKKDIIGPINNKVITLTVKLGLWGLLAGFLGSGLMMLLLKHLTKPTIMGGQ